MFTTRAALAFISTSLAALSAAVANPLVDLQSSTPLTLGERVDGEISEQASLHEAPCAPTGGPERVFTLTVPQRSAVALSAEAEFSPILTVYTDETAVACGPSAVDVTLSPGTYTVVVEGDVDAVGPFSLSAHGDPLEPSFAELADPPAPVEAIEVDPFEDTPTLIDDPIEAALNVHNHEGEQCATARYDTIMQAAEAMGVGEEAAEILYADALNMQATAIDLFEGEGWSVDIPDEDQWGPLEEEPAPDYATSTQALGGRRTNLYKACPGRLADRDKTFVFDTPQGNFRLHYKVCGADRVPEAWVDTAATILLPDGTRTTLGTDLVYSRTNAPDSVERVGAYMEYGRARFAGHRMKVNNGRLNVYLHASSDYCGLHSWFLFVHHIDIATNCMGMSTPVHEVFHEVQSLHGFLKTNLGTFARAAVESGARYAQTLVGAHVFDRAIAYSRPSEFAGSLASSAPLTRYFGLFYGYLTEQYATVTTPNAVGFGGDSMNELLRAFESDGWNDNGFVRFLRRKSTNLTDFVRSFYLQLVTHRFAHTPASLPIANGLKRDFAYRRTFDLDARVVNNLTDCIQFDLGTHAVVPGKRGMRYDTTTQCITDHQILMGPYGGAVGRFELEPITLPDGQKITLTPDEIAVEMQMYPSDSIRAVYNFGQTDHLPEIVDGWLLEAGAEQPDRNHNHIYAAHEVDPFVRYFSPSNAHTMIIDDSRQRMILRPHADMRSLYFVFTHAYSTTPYQGARRRVRIAVTPTWLDSDRDGFPNRADNCPYTANSNQTDADGDGVGDACDVCPALSDAQQDDSDHDGIGDACDLCPSAYDSGVDDDGDGVGDACDVCPHTYNPNQADGDGDGRGDACDACPSDYDFTSSDYDGDGVPDACDNCVTTANPDQRDRDNNGAGDACEYITGVSVSNSTPAMCVDPWAPQIFQPAINGWYSANSGAWTFNGNPQHIVLGPSQVPQFSLYFEELAADLIDIEFSYCVAGQCGQNTTPWFTHSVRKADWTLQGNQRGTYQAQIAAPCLPGSAWTWPTFYPTCSHMPGDAFEVYAEWVFYPGGRRQKLKIADVSIALQEAGCTPTIEPEGPVLYP